MINLSGYNFSGPYYHTRRFNNSFACVYVLVNGNNQVIDVGQTDSINDRIINHERKACWYRHGCNELSLYIYINNDPTLRLLLERLIRLSYNPPCGQI